MKIYPVALLVAGLLGPAACHRANPLYGQEEAGAPPRDGDPLTTADAPAEVVANLSDGPPRARPDGPDIARDDGPAEMTSASDALPRSDGAMGDRPPPAVDAAENDLLVGLVGAWRLDEGTGRTAEDLSGNRNHGTLRDLDSTAWKDGRFGKAVEFPDRGWIRVADSESLDSITGAYTVAAWILNETNDGNHHAIASRQVGTSDDEHYGLFLANNELRFYMRQSSVVGNLTVPHGRWVHVAGSFDGNNMRLYLEGKPIGSALTTTRPTRDVTPFVIGGNNDTNLDTAQYHFEGRIDEVLLYRRALTDGELLQIAQGARPKP